MTEEKVMPAKKDASTALLDVAILLTEMNLPFCLDGGTLLGFYREGDFCEDDWDDIDLTLPADYWPVHEEINRQMLDLGFELYHSWPRDKENNLSGQYAWKRNGVKIDLMFKEVKGEKIWWTIYGGKAGVTYKAVPKDYLWPTTQMDRLYMRRPEKVEEYLAYRYGDWRMPVHRRDYSCYKTDRCIVPGGFNEI